MRRQLGGFSILCAASVVALAFIPMRARAQSGATGVAPVRSINHLHLRVSDSRRSFEFYSKLLGGSVIDTGGAGWTVKIGDTGSWLNLSGMPRPIPNVKPGTMDHLGIGIDLPKAPEPLRQALKLAFPSSNVRSPGQPGDLTYDRSIYITDPDGLSVQMTAKDDDGRLPRPDATPAIPRTRVAGAVRVRSINHLQFPVTEIAKTEAFYAKLLGATLRDKSTNGQSITMTLPDTNGWFSFSTTKDKEKAGKLDHVGIGIDWPKDPGALRSSLQAAFPNSNVRSPGSPSSSTYDRSIYIDDPDGLHIQLISSEDDGELPSGTMGRRTPPVK